jgi:hypothetical protein
MDPPANNFRAQKHMQAFMHSSDYSPTEYQISWKSAPRL